VGVTLAGAGIYSLGNVVDNLVALNQGSFGALGIHWPGGR
jgi:hypothetical protein